MITAIIIAAGDATRWNNYLGIPKHFIEIDGEPIIKRTVRLLRENGVDDIHIVGPDKSYSVPGASLYIPNKNPENGDLDKFMNSRHLWSKGGRTVVLYGDVFFTEDAMKWILTDQRKEFVLHCRPFNSNLTGTKWGECFALTFDPKHQPQLDKVFERTKQLFADGKLGRMGGWEVYKVFLLEAGIYQESMLGNHWVTGHSINEIADWTDDFDYPEDYDRFVERYNG